MISIGKSINRYALIRLTIAIIVELVAGLRRLRVYVGLLVIAVSAAEQLTILLSIAAKSRIVAIAVIIELADGCRITIFIAIFLITDLNITRKRERV